jgi:hypothetical protein
MTRRPLGAFALALALAVVPGGAAAAATTPPDVAARDVTALTSSPEPAVAAYERSWTHRALGLQSALGDDVGLRDAPFVGTHNSFNSIAEMGPTLSDLDSNQRLSLTDQLRVDVRSLELDLHWFPSLAAGGAQAPVVCHAESQHEGCSIERPLGPVLGEIATWLHAHDDQVLLLYLEDHLDGTAGHDAAAATIRSALGGLLYAPAPGPSATCAAPPLDLTRNAIRASGARVILVSSCGAGTAWPGVAYDWSSAHVETRPVGFQAFPSCGPDFSRATYDRTLVRYFEDSTGLTAAASQVGAATADDGITPATAAAMARCGVDLVGLDQLMPQDGRLDALVWSWAPGEPRAGAGDCALQRGDGRWRVRRCGERHRAACRTAGGTWTLSRTAVPVRAAEAACRDRNARFAVPRTGYEGQLLLAAAGDADAWLGLRRSGAAWRALDAR